MAGITKQRRSVKEKLIADKNKEVNKLFDICIADHSLKNDAALSRTLKVAPPVISKMRHGTLFPGASILVSIHENIGLSFQEMRKILGVPPEYKF
jgi:hypothetical protein